MKRISFLPFGQRIPSSCAEACSEGDLLLQSIDLAVAAEDLGADGIHFGVD